MALIAIKPAKYSSKQNAEDFQGRIMHEIKKIKISIQA